LEQALHGKRERQCSLRQVRSDVRARRPRDTDRAAYRAPATLGAAVCLVVGMAGLFRSRPDVRLCPVLVWRVCDGVPRPGLQRGEQPGRLLGERADGLSGAHRAAFPASSPARSAPYDVRSAAPAPSGSSEPLSKTMTRAPAWRVALTTRALRS